MLEFNIVANSTLKKSASVYFISCVLVPTTFLLLVSLLFAPKLSVADPGSIDPGSAIPIAENPVTANPMTGEAADPQSVASSSPVAISSPSTPSPTGPSMGGPSAASSAEPTLSEAVSGEKNCNITLGILKAEGSLARNRRKTNAKEKSSQQDSSFETVHEQRRTIKFQERTEFRFTPPGETTEHLFFVQPETMVGSTVILVVEWRTGTGEQLVASKLRVINGQSVLFGTDVDTKTSVVLSVEALCR